jgi:hypothetical protein
MKNVKPRSARAVAIQTSSVDEKGKGAWNADDERIQERKTEEKGL